MMCGGTGEMVRDMTSDCGGTGFFCRRIKVLGHGRVMPRCLLEVTMMYLSSAREGNLQQSIYPVDLPVGGLLRRKGLVDSFVEREIG